jgi:hypothetical protein
MFSQDAIQKLSLIDFNLETPDLCPWNWTIQLTLHFFTLYFNKKPNFYF